MMHRPPYVPKLHSSQILTRVSGRTYESQTGLRGVKKRCVCVCGGGGGEQGSFVSMTEAATQRVPFSVTKRKKKIKRSPFSVAFLTEAANG